MNQGINIEHNSGMGTNDIGTEEKSNSSAARLLEITVPEDEDDDYLLDEEVELIINPPFDASLSKSRKSDEKSFCSSSYHQIQSRKSPIFFIGNTLGKDSEPQIQSSFPCKSQSITDEYRITSEIIGIGESGKVMGCFSKEYGNKFALKVLRDSNRSRREIDLHHYAGLQHENITQIMDIYENTFEGIKCLLVVVEFMEGGDLLTLFEKQNRVPYSENCVARVLYQIGSAIQFLHDRNIAHRDVKLENILCSSTNLDTCIFKLADFGFAKKLEFNRPMMSPCCTPAYVCPEILSRIGYDKGCDVWALGVATYILLAGYPPFYSYKGLAFSPGMRDRIRLGIFAFPQNEWNSIPDSTKKLICSMLKTDPDERITIHGVLESELVRSILHLGTNGTFVTMPNVPSTASISEATDKITPLNSCIKPPSSRTRLSARSGAVPGVEVSDAMKTKKCTKKPVSATLFVDTANLNSSENRMRNSWGFYSIQEEVNRALMFMRLSGQICYLKNPSSCASSNSNTLLSRRRILKQFSDPKRVAKQSSFTDGILKKLPVDIK